MSEPRDHDDVFEAIVAGWDDEVPPATEMDELPPPLVRAEPAAYVDPADDEHFVPPPPPPVPHFAPETWWGMTGIVGGLLLVFLLPWLDVIDRTPWRDRLGVIAIVGGIGLLVWRMRDDPHDDDDGAVI